ncbi:MAG TPA: tol-pal system protein YbgF [Xanthomonadales bacterium]|nr:tol-pal system protein YbgF [Xanthomonadales bacterium]
MLVEEPARRDRLHRPVKTQRYDRFAVILGTAAILAAVPAFGQSRQSLAERVERLEAEQQRQAGSNRDLELINRITELQAEVMALRGELEQQRFEIEQLKQRNRDQYLDLDGRLARLESASAAGDAAGVPAGQAADAASGADTATHPSSPTGSSGIVAGIATANPTRPGSDRGAAGDVANADGNDPAAAPARPEGERAAYDFAFEALKQGEYAEAARRFQSFEREYPDGELAANAGYWLGESYYVTQNFELALDTFQRVLERHPDSAKAPDARLKLGYSQYELKRYPEARATLADVVERYPDSTVARLAQGRLRQMTLDGRN